MIQLSQPVNPPPGDDNGNGDEPIAKRFRSLTLKDDLERQQETLEQIVQQLKDEISKYVQVIVATHDEASIELTKGILENDKQILDKIAIKFDKVKDQCLSNNQRRLKNELGVCHRCESGGTTKKDDGPLFQCKCFDEGCQTPLYVEGETSTRGLRLCRRCTYQLQQEQQQKQDVPLLMVCAVCNALDCTTPLTAGEVASEEECETDMINVSPHKWCSDHFEDPSTAEIVHLCVDCTETYTLLRPTTCMGLLCPRKVFNDKIVPTRTMQQRHCGTLSKSDNTIYDQVSDLQDLADKDLLGCILSYLDPWELYRLALTSFAHYKAAQTYSQYIYEQRTESFIVPSTDIGFSYSGPNKNWCQQLWRLHRCVFRDFGFQFMKDYDGATRYLHRHDNNNSNGMMIFTSIKSTFDNDDLVKGCQIGPPENDPFERGGILAAVCGNKAIPTSQSSGCHFVIGFVRMDGTARMSIIDVGLVAQQSVSDSSDPATLLFARRDRHWIAKVRLRFVIRSLRNCEEQKDAIFGIKYDTSAKTLSTIIFSGDMENYYVKDPWDESDYIVYQDTQDVTCEEEEDDHYHHLVPEHLNWAVLLDGKNYPLLSLRDCCEDEYDRLREKILDAVEDDACVRVIHN